MITHVMLGSLALESLIMLLILLLSDDICRGTGGKRKGVLDLNDQSDQVALGVIIFIDFLF